ncbi:MAG: TadE/TadG family type IV pilus assembly protein [Granulosicoccus sp.]
MKHRGSATVEVVFCLWMLLPIGFGIVAIGKLIDLRQTSEQASRYAVWQSTVGSGTGTRGTETDLVVERFYSDPVQPIVSRGAQDASETPGNHPLWGATDSPRLSATRFQSDIQLEQDQSIAVRYTHDQSAAPIASGLSQSVEALGSLLRGVDGNAWDLTVNGLLKSEVDVGLHANAWLPGTSAKCRTTESGACVTSSSVILSDGWGASSDAHARRRVRSLLPTSTVEQVGNVVADVGGLFLFPELKGLRGALGHVDMNVLPEYANQ